MIFRWQDLYDFFGGKVNGPKKAKIIASEFFVKTYIIHYLEAIIRRWASTLLLLHENLQLFLFKTAYNLEHI